MKKVFKIIVPILLAITILLITGWYFFRYDRDFTRDMLLQCARHFEQQGEMTTASWFYDLAYNQGNGNEAIAIELARQYIDIGNYTQAEVTLNRAIRDGAGASVYAALCQAYVAQDKLLDAVELLDSITDPSIKAQLDAQRPATPTADQTPGFYNAYLTVHIQADGHTLYVNSQGQYPSVVTDLYTQPVTLVDGENVIYAIAVSDSGLVSPRAMFGYTVGGVIEEVVFSDPSIEELIRSTLHVPQSKVLYSNDLWGIRELTVPLSATDYSDLRHLAYLESLTIVDGAHDQLDILPYFTTLKSLHIENTYVSDRELSVIGSLTSLEQLTLSNCNIASVKEFSTLVNLTDLNLSNNAIGNIQAICQLPRLQSINLSGNALVELSQLTACVNLTALDISYNSVSDLSALTQLPALTTLKAGHNQLTDISCLSRLPGLKTLELQNNTIASLSGLVNCKSLTDLDISYNRISDLAVLGGITTLENLNFSNNQVTSLPKFSSNCQLVTINGSYNSLSDLSNLSVLSNLNSVYMDYNEKISSVDALANCPVLILVNVYGTKVTDVSALTAQSIVVNYDPTR